MSVTEMTCNEVRETLPAYLDGGGDSLALRRHLSHCKGCKAELAAYEDLRASLASMESATAIPPRGLVHALMRIPEVAGRVDHVRAHIARNRNQYLGGAAVVVAGAVGAALLRSRRGVATA